MSSLENAIVGVKAPIVDHRIAERIHFVTTCIIPDDIISLFSEAFVAIADEMDLDNYPVEQMPNITCVFTERSKMGVVFDENEESLCMSICVYRIDRIRRHNVVKQLTIIVEELIHLIWSITNEYDVCFKVFEIVKRMRPHIKITDLYNMENAKRYK